MRHRQLQQFNPNKQNFHENSLLKTSSLNRNIPKTAPRKSRKDANVSSSEFFDISEEDFFGSMLAVDIHPICNPKRISKTPIAGKRKRKIYDNEAIPIPKINTQKSLQKYELQRASTTTSVKRPSRNNAISSTSHFIASNYSQNLIQIQNPESQSSNLIDPLTIKQIDTGILPKKASKSSQLSISYGSISQSHKIIQRPQSNFTNRPKSPKRKKCVEHFNSKETDIKSIKDDEKVSNEKVSTLSDDCSKKNIIEKNKPIVKFDKKSFLKKLDDDCQDIRVKSTISFVNGRVLPSLHYQKEPDRYVIACAIHIEFSFNFFTLATNPIIEKHLIIDEESYDLFDSNFEYSNRLYRSSRFMRLQKEILKESPYKDPLTALMTVTPSLTRRNIEKQHLFQQMKTLSSSNSLSSVSLSEISNQIQKKYQNNVTTDSAFPLILYRIDYSQISNDNVVIDETDDDDKFDIYSNNYSCSLSGLKSLSSLL